MPPRKYKNSFTIGLETILNTPGTFLGSSKVFNEIHEKSGMSASAMLKHIGKKKRANVPKEKSDEEKSKERLGKLEAAAAQ